MSKGRPIGTDERTAPGRLLVSLLIISVVVAILNFVSFFIISSHLGGDAFNGKVEGGRYFLASHGRFTEVSAQVFTYSRWHAMSLFVTHPIGMCAMAWLVLIMRRSRFFAPLMWR